MIYANDFRCGNDNETIEKALLHLDSDRTLCITPREAADGDDRAYWLLDRAILLSEDTTLIVRNATLKLSDRCRDNFIRSANCGFGHPDPERIKNIRIIGEGNAVLLGADRPRAVGDHTKIIADPCPYTDEELCKYAPWVDEGRRALGTPDFFEKHSHSFGTDANRPDESQQGDWRGVGILLANVENFLISGLRIVESHGWGVSCEACAYGRIEKMSFDARMCKEIDGMLQNLENEDGVDLRNGCHDIIITDITGRTGDDIVALTAIADPNFLPGGSLGSTHVMPNDWTKRSRDIYNIIIRNVMGYSSLCWMVRLLPAEAHIYNVVIDGVVDTAPAGLAHGGPVILGEPDGGYGCNPPDGMKNITVNNVVSNGHGCVLVNGFVSDSAFSNIISGTPGIPAIAVTRKDGFKNNVTSTLVTNNADLIVGI